MNETTQNAITEAPVAVSESEQQARAQMESIIEMVAGLDRETAAQAYAAGLSEERARQLLTERGWEDTGEMSVDELHELIAEHTADGTIDPDDFEFDEDEARQAIEDDALEILMRSDWKSYQDDWEAGEYMILLSTGGPACRIVGELRNGQPHTARLEHQDWFTPWTELIDGVDHQALLTYARVFYYGE